MLWMVGMVVVGRQPLFVVDHIQIECWQMLMFTLGVAMQKQVLRKSVDIL